MLALVKSKYPEATGNQLIQHLIHFVFGAEDDSTWGWRRDIGFGSASVPNMLAHDPTGWPDENPLLLDTVTDIEATYPFTIYGQTDDEAADDDPTPAATDDTTAEATDDGPPTAAILALAGTALAALAAVVLLVLRRRRTSGGVGAEPATDREA